MHIILFPKTKLKRIKLIKTIFCEKNLKMKVAGFWKSSPHSLWLLKITVTIKVNISVK